MLESSAFTTLVQVVKTYSLPIILALITIYLLHNKYGSGLNHIPGPSLAGWTKLWRLNDVRKGQAHMTAIKLHKKYGKLVRTAPNVVDVSDPSMIPKAISPRYSLLNILYYYRDTKIAYRRVSTQSRASHGRKSRR
jgi:hypothetical protein